MDRNSSRHGLRSPKTVAGWVLLLTVAAGLIHSTYADTAADESLRNKHGRLTVCKHGCRFEKIQHAVNAARSGDTIYIGPGTYFENVVIDRKSLTLVGSSADETTVDGGFRGSVFTLTQATGALSSVTITHGMSEVGGGIAATDSVFEVTDTIIVSNEARQSGGGLSAVGESTPITLDRCVIAHNHASGGGGIYLDPEAAVNITDSSVAHNEADAGGGVLVSYAAFLTMNGTTVSDNSAAGNGGGIWRAVRGVGEPSSSVTLDHSAIVNNTAGHSGGGIFNFETNHVFVQGGTVIALNTPGP